MCHPSYTPYTIHVLHYSITHYNKPYNIYYNILLFFPFLLFKIINGEHSKLPCYIALSGNE